MKLKCIVFGFVMISTLCFAASFDLEKIDEPMSLIIERGKAIDSGESSYKLEKIEKSIDAKLQKMFPAGMIIDSKEKGFHFRKTQSKDYMTGNLAFQLLNENNEPFEVPYSQIRNLTVIFEYTPAKVKYGQLPPTSNATAEKIEEGEVFDAKLSVAKHKSYKKTYDYGGRMMGSDGIVIYCKVLKIY